MPSVCFTGRGYDRAGQWVTRSLWEGNARMYGYDVTDQVRCRTDYLVSSRSDTEKVRTARDWGVTILTYNEWSDMILPRQADGRPLSPGYSIGYFRRQFTAMSGDTCLSRHDNWERAVQSVRNFARERGIADPRIVWTTEAERERDRSTPARPLPRDMETAAGYGNGGTPYSAPAAPAIPRGVTWDAEYNVLRGAMHYPLPVETHRTWGDRLLEFPSFFGSRPAASMRRSPLWWIIECRGCNAPINDAQNRENGQLCDVCLRAQNTPEPHPLGGVRRVLNLDGD